MRATPTAAEGIDLVEEDDAGRVFLRMAEEVADPSRSDPDEHLHKVGSAQGKVGNTCLACHRPGEERLSGPRRSDQEDAAWHPSTQVAKVGGRPQKLDHLLQLMLCLVNADYVGEGHRGRVGLTGIAQVAG